MKFLCPACDRLLELASYRVEADALVVRCARCGVETYSRPEPRPIPSSTPHPSPPKLALAPESPSIEQDSFDAPAGFCPKCLGPKSERVESCPACGLVFANVQQAEFYPRQEVAEQWRELLAQWGDPSKHEQFLKSMAALGELVSAGRLYRLRLAIAPSDAIAQRGRDEVVRLATIGSPLFNNEFSKEPGEVQRTFRWQHVALGVFILLCITMVVVLFRQVAQRLP